MIFQEGPQSSIPMESLDVKMKKIQKIGKNEHTGQVQ